MRERKLPPKSSKMLILAILSFFTLEFSLLGKTLNAHSPIPNSLFNKIIKEKYQKKPSKKGKKEKKKEEKSFFDLNILTSEFSSWGIDPNKKIPSINLTPAWKIFKKKKEVIVAVIDTGIDPQHPFLKKNIYTPKGSITSKNYGVDFSKNKKLPYTPKDSHGHGTHVSGIIKSVYPEVKILPLKYYNPKASGQDNLESTIEALRYAVSQNVDIINYSGGGPEPALEELKILKEAEKKGILIVAAAGNEESNIDIRSNAYYPASYGLKNIITVTAHDKKVKMLRSSNWGKKSVDISAPGYRIRSSLPQGRAGYLTGTSQATAFVSGVAALLMGQYPKLSAEEIKNILKASAKKEKNFLSKCSSGGRLDAGHAQSYASEYIKNKSRAIATKKKNGGGVAKIRETKIALRSIAKASPVYKKKNIKPGKIIYRKSH